MPILDQYICPRACRSLLWVTEFVAGLYWWLLLSSSRVQKYLPAPRVLVSSAESLVGCQLNLSVLDDTSKQYLKQQDYHLVVEENSSLGSSHDVGIASMCYRTLFFFSRQGFSVYPLLPGTHSVDQKSTCLCLRSARIKGVWHHCLACALFFMWVLGVWTPVFPFAQQILYPLRELFSLVRANRDSRSEPQESVWGEGWLIQDQKPDKSFLKKSCLNKG